MASNVTKNQNIVDFRYEEMGTGKNGIMTAAEKFVVARFRTEIVVTSENGAPLSLFDRALLMEKNTKEINYEYQPMEWLNLTSNVVERLLSRAKKVLSDHRMSMLPMNLEETLFLYINEWFWDIDVINLLSNNKKLLQLFFCKTECGNYYFQ